MSKLKSYFLTGVKPGFSSKSRAYRMILYIVLRMFIHESCCFWPMKMYNSAETRNFDWHSASSPARSLYWLRSSC